jgi:hypothetical protein
MGILQLPQAKDFPLPEARAPRPVEKDFSGLAALQQSQRNLANTAFQGALKIAGQVIDLAKNDQMNAATQSYSAAAQEQLLALEKVPVTPTDPRYADVPDTAKAFPNTYVFEQWKKKYMDSALSSISLPSVKKAFSAWSAEKGLSEKQGLAMFDIKNAREVSNVNSQTAVANAVAQGNRAEVVRISDEAVRLGTWSEAQAMEKKNLAFANISSREKFMQSLTMPTASTPERRLLVKPPVATEGVLKTGNIDLNTTPIVKNPDGTISTVKSIRIQQTVQSAPPYAEGGGKTTVEVLIPTISPDGKVMSKEEAIAQYEKTGRNLGTFKDAASADAYAKSLSDAMSKSYIPAQSSGLEWLADKNNLKYTNWDGKEASLSVGDQENLINKYKIHLQEVAEQRDTFYSDVHIRADTIEKVDQALAMLTQDKTLAGVQKYNWETRFEQARAYLLSLANLKSKAARDAHEDWLRDNEDRVRGKLASLASKNPNDIRGLQDILDAEYLRPDRQVSGKFYEEMQGKYKRGTTPAYKLATDMMQKQIDKLPPDKQYVLMSRFVTWFDDPSHKIAPNEEQVSKAIKNIMSKDLFKAVDSAFPAYIEAAGAGAFTGNTEVNMDEIQKMVPVALNYAKKNWPEMGLKYGAIDALNEYGFGEGMAILQDANQKAYAFKKEGGKLNLYTYGQTRGGKYEWQQVLPSPKNKMSAKETELRAAEAHAQAEAEEWKVRPDKTMPRYGVEHDSKGWYVPSESAIKDPSKRQYIPADLQKQYDDIYAGGAY